MLKLSFGSKTIEVPEPLLPIRFHLAVALGIALNMALLRIPACNRAAHSLLSFVPDSLGGGDYYDPEPLGVANWISHWPIMFYGMETGMALWNNQP